MAQLKLTEKIIASIEAPTDEPQAYYWDTELVGFGLVVGRTGARTFVARSRVGGRKVKVTIGVAGRVREDGHHWTATLARQRAKELLGEMAAGEDPNAERRTSRSGITVREALALHLDEMRDNGRRDISIATVEYDVTRLLARELDHPLAALNVEAVQKIKERGRAHRTQTNRLLAHISAIWNTARRLRRDTFTGDNPVGPLGVSKFALTGAYAPEQARIEEPDMPEWLRRLELMTNPIRRDLQLTALFTGMRDSNVTGLRWEMVDWDRGGLVVPVSKTTPFTVPLAPTVLEVLKRRRTDNAEAYRDQRGDHGWVFPTLDNAGKVTSISETKERRHDTVAPPWGDHRGGSKYKATGARVLYLPGLHTLRRTFLSIAAEAGVSKLDQMVLSNHTIGGRDVHDGYVRQSYGHLRDQVAKIDGAMWLKLRPSAK